MFALQHVRLVGGLLHGAGRHVRGVQPVPRLLDLEMGEQMIKFSPGRFEFAFREVAFIFGAFNVINILSISIIMP